MANVQRHAYGVTNPIMCPVDSARVIEEGDNLFLESNDVRAADDLTYLTSLAATQENFAGKFAGVAGGASASGDTDNVIVMRSGIFEMKCASAAHELGDYVGVDDNAGGTALVNQQVIKVTDRKLAIGQIAKREASAVTKVMVELLSPMQMEIFGGKTDKYVIEENVTANGTIAVNKGFKFRVTDAHIICTDNAEGTVDIKNGTTAITSQFTHGTNDKAIVRATTIDDAQYEVAADGTLNIVTATGGKCRVIIEYVLVI